jgi:hypothetical protein
MNESTTTNNNSHDLPTAQLRLGQLVATPAAIEAMARAGQDPAQLLARHRSGDWGEVDAEDAAANDRAVKQGERVVSAYRLLADGTRVWVITEADRSSTCILLPNDY